MAASDGSTASYYELPKDATQLQDLIAYKNMNAQMGEIFRANYRYGECDHSDKLREINKILYYAQAEKDRLLKYEMAIPLAPTKEEKSGSSKSEYAEATYAERAKAEQERKAALAEADAPEVFKETEKLICKRCNKEIIGRVYYQGNEPKCKICAGEK